MSNSPLNSPLNQRSSYVDQYDKTLLFPIPRVEKRTELGILQTLPFYGYDLWTAYELSWLDEQGKPHVAVGDIVIPCESRNLIESKSFKLYLNSFNNTVLASEEAFRQLLVADLSEAVAADVVVNLSPVEPVTHPERRVILQGMCLDDLDVVCTEYQVNPRLLRVHEDRVEDLRVYSHLLKSNCLVTGQPDWGSVFIAYSGQRIDEAALLKYLVSFRNHNEFHEQCVERIFMDLLTYCNPETLTVTARYTRRGGLDINPIRSSQQVTEAMLQNQPLFRQ